MALRAAVEAITTSEDLALAQAILDGAGISLPGGKHNILHCAIYQVKLLRATCKAFWTSFLLESFGVPCTASSIASSSAFLTATFTAFHIDSSTF